ncbi:MAG TPA: aminotransferase class V-fold PLP-dependent enzyme [Gemmatimonadaceae bacterium]|jgi:selenocysteine lyase/cysteine desulfurase
MSYDVEALRREEFAWANTGESIYFNHASTGPLPARTVAKLDEWSRLRTIPTRISQELQFGTLARGRELIASLIGADVSEIAMATNTSYGVNLAAFSLPLEEGDVILSPTGEFPANVYPWMSLAKRRGLVHRLVDCDRGVLTYDRLREELDKDEEIRVVAVSWVQFATGATVDLRALGGLCRERGVYFFVDAIQGVGPARLNLRDTHIDILSCGAQKWLMSPWGSAFLYVRRELIERLEPHEVSWFAVRDSDDFSRLTNYDLTWRQDARKFEMITLPYQDFAGMVASLELITSLGADAIVAHTRRLVQMMIDWASDRDDIEIVTPTDAIHHAGIVSLRLSSPTRVSAALTEANVAHSLREGAIRLSPYFYNTEEEVSRVLALLSSG